MMALQPPVQRSAADPEDFRSGHSVAVHLAQHLEDVLTLYLLERRRAVASMRARRSRLRGGRIRTETGCLSLRTEGTGELALRQERPIGQHARALDDVLQLTHVAVPPGAEQQPLR